MNLKYSESENVSRHATLVKYLVQYFEKCVGLQWLKKKNFAKYLKKFLSVTGINI